MAAANMNKWFLWFCVLLNIGNIDGIVNIDPEKKEQIDHFVNSLLFECDKHNVVGMNLVVVYEGEILYTTVYGLRNIGASFYFIKNVIAEEIQ